MRFSTLLLSAALPCAALCATYDAAGRTSMLARHNDVRRGVSPTAADMTLLTWDSDLADAASDYAERCVFQHDSNRGDGFDSSVGENLAAGYPIDNQTPVADWADEAQWYSFSTNSCQAGKVCGHHTQIIWADSTRLGCGYATCTGNEIGFNGAPSGDVVLYTVCRYSPAGNFVGQAPYVAGEACSQCNEDTHPYCVDGLCSETEGVPEENDDDAAASVAASLLAASLAVAALVL